MPAVEEYARAIFLSAIEQPPDQWPAFLDDACGRDEPLRQAVERLRQVDAHPVGVVLNMVPNKRHASGYGYGYGYGYAPEQPAI